ncbi:MAG: 2-hydroxyacyl-CoA dehydratase family protein [Dehalococcoidia bacterium]|nr:2-hydroxyacyl-CoA dehydratase family protein [Dehalococcoidia bacterium]
MEIKPVEAIEEAMRVNATFPYTDPSREWKEKGGKVVGYNCIFIPEELIHAAGMLPFRITGDNKELGLDNANVYLYTSTCSYIRSCFELALGGGFDFLDGYLSASACEGVQRLGEVWSAYLKVPMLMTLDVPRKINQRCKEFYRDDLATMKTKLEEQYGVKITDEKLWASIKLYDETRALFHELYEMRKAENPPIYGSEVMELLNAAVRMPREEYNPLLRRAIQGLKVSGRQLTGKTRVMVSSSVLNNAEFLRGVERLGALVVTDDVCTGARYFWEPASENMADDPLQVLANRALGTGFPCPRTNPPVHRTERILKMAEDWRVNGLIALTMRNCAPYVLDLPMWKSKLEEKGISVLDLDIEYGGTVTGPARIRIEAFVEMLSMQAVW